MNTVELTPAIDDFEQADNRHPVDFLEPLPHADESAQRTCEALSRTFMWIADGDSLDQKGLRATIVLYCVRADLLDGISLEDIGFRAGCSTDEVENLVSDFCHAIGW